MGRDVEIARGIERGIASLGRVPLRRSQNWEAHPLERLRDQRRADDPPRVSRAQLRRASAPLSADRQRQEVAGEIDDVLDVVFQTYAADDVAANELAVALRQSDRAADARSKVSVFRQR